MDTNITLNYLFPNADDSKDWKIKQKDDVQEITEWGLPDPQPTTAELEAAWPAAEADFIAKQEADATAKADIIAEVKQKLGFTDEEYDIWVSTL